MFQSLKDLEKFTVKTTDGDVGRVRDVLFDDARWIVRYLVVEPAGEVAGPKVLISPVSISRVEQANQTVHLTLTKEKVSLSPPIDTDKPVSRQHERDYYRYYGYAPYWGFSGLWGEGDYPGLLATAMWRELPVEHSTEADDPHLRSATEIRGYHIQGSDALVGHIDDFVVDDTSWQMRYLIVDTSDWWFGKKVLIAPHWASGVGWAERKVYVDMSRKGIKNCPEWSVNAIIEREYEERLYDYYGRPVYWDGTKHAVSEPASRASESQPR